MLGVLGPEQEAQLSRDLDDARARLAELVPQFSRLINIIDISQYRLHVI